MMNVDERILMEAIEVRTRQEMRQRDRQQYPDDYFDCDEAGTAPMRPPTPRVSLKPDELALHQQLLEMAKAAAPVPPDSFFG
jgi:hypothetical protein